MLNPVMYAHLSLYENKLQCKKVFFSQFLKGLLQFIKTSYIGCINCFEKIYFNGICALSKKNSQFHAFLCVRSKSQILRVKNVKNQNVTHPNAAKLTTLRVIKVGHYINP